MLKYSQQKFKKPKQGGGPNDFALHANKRAHRDGEQCGNKGEEGAATGRKGRNGTWNTNQNQMAEELCC